MTTVTVGLFYCCYVVKMEVKVDPEIVENIRRVAEVDIKNIKEEVKVDPEVMEKDLLQMDVVINNVTSTFQ